MKICHITIVHKRSDIRIFHKECKSLKNLSNDIHIVVADGLGDEVVDGIEIHDLGKPSGRLSRFLYTAKKARAKAESIRADIYHLHDPELLRISKALKRKNFAKVIFDSHEDTPGQILSKPYIPFFLRKIVSVLVEYYENRTLKSLDGIVTATPYIRDRLKKINNNCIDINNFPLLKEIDISEEVTEKENKVCFIGGISEIRGITELVKALEFLNTSLDLAGEIPIDYKNKLQKIKGWEKVNELGFISREKAMQVKKSSLAGIVTFLPVPNHINAQPNKIFEYMASGIPVIGSHFKLWKDIIESNNCGICVNPGKPEEVANAIKIILQNPDKAESMGNNGIKLVQEKYNWNIEEIKLINFYKSVLD